MEPDKSKPRKPGSQQRDEYVVSWSTRGLGRNRQRSKLQQPMESSGAAPRFAHGEDSSFDSPSNPPQHDRAG